MRIFRIYKDGRLPNDAVGAKITGGRWNPKDYRVLYASTHLSLACLESLVHLERGVVPCKLRYASTEVPAPLRSLDPRKEYVRQGSAATAEIGKQWLVQDKELVVRVPSALIPEEDNILVNPDHENYDALQWDSYPFELERRLLELITEIQQNFSLLVHR